MSRVFTKEYSPRRTSEVRAEPNGAVEVRVQVRPAKDDADWETAYVGLYRRGRSASYRWQAGEVPLKVFRRVARAMRREAGG